MTLLQTAKGAKIFSAAIAATGDGQQTGKDGEEKMKMHTHSYCCLDYAQVHFQRWYSFKICMFVYFHEEGYSSHPLCLCASLLPG